MKIKEIEELTGMSKDNIRFYERQGLIEPLRNSNGYREYDENDVQTLKRIKLLRSLHVSIEDIKNIQENEVELVNILDKHIEKIEKEKLDLEISAQVCKQMISDKVKYVDLDADSYLQAFDINHDNNELKKDVCERLNAPWKRYFAYSSDLCLYRIFLECILIFIFDVNLNATGVDTIVGIFSMVFLLFVEPFLLSKFKTTFGKAIFGLTVTDNQGNALTYMDAFNRTLNKVVYGFGLGLPIVSILCMIYNYIKSTKDDLVWEKGSIQTLKDDKTIRIFIYLIVFVIQFVLSFGISNYSLLPENRGELTVKEFIENIEDIENIYDDKLNYILNEDGSWSKDSMQYDDEVNNTVYPNLNFVVEDNELVEISFHKKFELSELYDDHKLMNYTILAYLKAQPSYTPWNTSAETIINKINKDLFQDFSYQKYGVLIKLNYEYDDSNPTSEVDFDNYSFTFIIRKEK